MAKSRATRIAYILFPLYVAWLVASSLLGWPVHWSNWVTLGAISLMLASTFVRPRASEFLTIGSAALMLVSFVGSVASKFR